MSAQAWIAIVVGLAAVVDDLHRRHIANWIPAAALAGGIGWQVGRAGWQGALTAAGGAALGFAVFLVFFLLGGMGGGDIKLMAGFGALLGPVGLLEAAFWTALLGGLFAVGALVWVRARRLLSPIQTGTGAGAGAGAGTRAGAGVGKPNLDESIPYAPAIALGVWLSLLPKG